MRVITPLLDRENWVYQYFMRNEYITEPCASPGCTALVDIPPWFKPFAEYCDTCRLEQKERFALDEETT